MTHEDAPPCTPVPTMAPPPEPHPDTERPGAPTAPTPVEATPDRTDEILAAIAGLGATLESVRREGMERDKSLADGIMASNAGLRDEFNTKLDSVAASTKQALDGSHRWLAEWANQNAYEADRKWDLRATKLEGEIKAIAKVVEDGFAASSKQIDKLARIVGSVLTHVAQSGGQKLDDGEQTSDAHDALAATRSR